MQTPRLPRPAETESPGPGPGLVYVSQAPQVIGHGRDKTPEVVNWWELQPAVLAGWSPAWLSAWRSLAT